PESLLHAMPAPPKLATSLGNGRAQDEATMPQRTSLYDWHVAHGARMVDFAGWDMPVQYTTIIEEHQAVRTAAGLFDISHMGRLWFAGAPGIDLVQKLFTN